MKRRNLGHCLYCDRPANSRELCAYHYLRQWKRERGGIEPIKRKLIRALIQININMTKKATSGRYPKFPGVEPRVYKRWTLINLRCSYPGTNKYEYYGGRGIRNLLSPYDLQALWDRDGAGDMASPSIDRINSRKHYSKRNCRFIEFDENRRRRRRTT